jgi:hypothetical protein
MDRGRVIGISLVVIGMGIAVIAGLFLAIQVDNESLSAGGAVLGAFFVFIPVALLVGFGLLMFIKAGQEAQEEAVMRNQRRLLDIVRSRGQVGVHEVALEMNVSVDSVKEMIHQLVGLQVFSGYVNWNDGVLYSSDASQLRDLDRCKRCGGDIQLVGKGVVLCPYCGTEYFLT